MAKGGSPRQERLRQVVSSLKEFQDVVKQQFNVESEITALQTTIAELNKNINDMKSKNDSHQTYMEATAKVAAMREREREKAAVTTAATQSNINYPKMMLRELVRITNSQEELAGTMRDYMEAIDRRDKEQRYEQKHIPAPKPTADAPAQQTKSGGMFGGLMGLIGGGLGLAFAGAKGLLTGKFSLKTVVMWAGETILHGISGLVRLSVKGLFKSLKFVGEGAVNLLKNSVVWVAKKLFSGVKGILRLGASGILKGLSKGGTVIMKVMKMGGGLLSKILIPFNVVMSLFQSVESILDTASIAKKLGKAQDQVTFFDRFITGLENFVANFLGNLIQPFLDWFGIDFDVNNFVLNGFSAIESAIKSATSGIDKKGMTKWAGDLAGDMIKSAGNALRSLWESVIGSITAMKDGILDWLESQSWLPDVAKEKIKGLRSKPEVKTTFPSGTDMAVPIHEDTSNATSRYFDPSKSGIFGGQSVAATLPFYQMAFQGQQSQSQNTNDPFLNPTPLYRPLTGDSVESNLLNLIGQKEAGGNYNVIYGGETIPLTDMSIGEVMDYQKTKMKNGSTAVGKYQFINSTLEMAMRGSGLSPNDMMSPENQDKMAMFLLKRRGLDEYKSGKMSEDQFASNLALEWASLPTINNVSAHAGVMGNKSLVSYKDFMDTVRGGSSNTGDGLIDSQRNVANAKTDASQKPVQVQQINNVNQTGKEGAGQMQISLRNEEPSFKKIIEQLAFNSMGVTGSPMFNS
jgi:muramidase (phage lysozyme)